jgi:hypothetical protein
MFANWKVKDKWNHPLHDDECDSLVNGVIEPSPHVPLPSSQYPIEQDYWQLRTNGSAEVPRGSGGCPF